MSMPLPESGLNDPPARVVQRIFTSAARVSVLSWFGVLVCELIGAEPGVFRGGFMGKVFDIFTIFVSLCFVLDASVSVFMSCAKGKMSVGVLRVVVGVGSVW